MRKVYWIIIAIVIIVAVAEGYALYKIPKSETLKGQLNYAHTMQSSPDIVFKLSLESRAQGADDFSILAASENNSFDTFPQSFNLPVLSKSLSNTGIYQLRVKVTQNGKVLYVNKGLLPLTRDDLVQFLNIEMQVPVTPRKKIIITPTILPTPLLQEVTEITPEPVKLDIENLLANKRWKLLTKEKNNAFLSFDIKKGYAFGSGGCNKFQGGYKVTQSDIVFNQFIASSKYCEGAMEVEAYFLESLPLVASWLVLEEGTSLHLYDQSNKPLLQFIAK